jgi:hypothetical protein
MSANRIRVAKILGTLSEVDARDFLCDLANLRDGDFRAVTRLRKTFPEMFHPHIVDGAVFTYAKYLRRAWDAPDLRHRDWYLFSLRQMHAKGEREARGSELKENSQITVWPGTGPELSEPPPEAAHMEAALYYLQAKVGDKAKHCEQAHCLRPYFISPKRWGKFCSEKCAGIANRESKRQWWSENRGKGAI